MNRREALTLLTALPMVKSIEAARVAPADVIVVEANEILSDASKRHITETLSKVWPNRQVVVFDSSLKMRIVREG